MPPTPTEETPTDTTTPTEAVQVDFGVGSSPPQPPYYEDTDLVAALGNTGDGVTENPSFLQRRRQGELANVTIVGGSFTFDDPNGPTTVTVRFRLAEGAEPRTLHLAAFVPGPFECEEIDERELFRIKSVRIEPGKTKSSTVAIPRPADVSGSSDGDAADRCRPRRTRVASPSNGSSVASPASFRAGGCRGSPWIGR